MSKDLEIALRIKADMDQARKELDGITDQLNQAGKSGADAADGLGDFDNAVAQSDKNTKSLGDSVARTMRDIKDFEEANNGAIGSLEGIAAQEQRLDRLFSQGAISMDEYENALINLDKSEAKLTKQEEELAKTHAKQAGELNKVLDATDKTAAQMRKLDAAADVLEKAFKDGRISIEQYNAALAAIDQQRAAIEGVGDAVEQLGTTSQSTRSQVITLARSLAAGNFGSAAFDLLRLATATNGAGAGFARLLLPVGAVVGVLGLLTAASVSAWRDQRELNNALLITGNTAGLTEGLFANLSREIEKNSNVTIGQAEEITLALARTGKFSKNVIVEYGRTIAALMEVTGRTADDLANELAESNGDTAKLAAKLNETWHFLTAAQYENIKALRARGDVEGAQLALSQALNETYADAVIKRVGDVDGAIKQLKKTASDYWNLAKNIFRTDDSALIERTQILLDTKLQGIADGNKRNPSKQVNPEADSGVKELRQQIKVLEDRNTVIEKKAADDAAKKSNEAEIIAAQNRIQDLALRADRELQMNLELKKLEEDFNKAREGQNGADKFSAAKEADLAQKIRDKYAKSTSDAGKAAENYVKSIEQQGAAAGLTAAEIDLLKIEELNLTEAQQKRLELARELIEAAEREKQQARDKADVIKLQIELLRAQGREFEAAAMEAEQQYGDLKTRLLKSGETQDAGIIDQVLDLKKLQARLTTAKEMIDKTLSDQSRQESSIDAQREAGLITEAEARRRIVELHRQTYDLLQKQRPVLEELAKQPGEVGESAVAALESMNTQAEKLLGTVSLLESTLKTSIEQGLTGAIEGLAKGTMTFGEAIQSLASTVADSIIRMQAEQIAESVTGSLFSFGKTPAAAGGEQNGTAAAITSAGNTAAQSIGGAMNDAGGSAGNAIGGLMMAAGADAGGGLGQALISAGQTVASLIAASMAAGQASSSAGSLIGAVGGAAGGSGSMTAATGGYVSGPGTSTSDSIPARLSDGEFVARAAVVAQRDALSFLHDFNSRGMAAVADWAPVRHATGGLAGVPAPSMGSPLPPTISDRGRNETALTQQQNFYLIDDPSRIHEVMAAPSSQKSLLIQISRDPAKFRNVLGL